MSDFRRGTVQIERALFNTQMAKIAVFEMLGVTGYVAYSTRSWADALVTFAYMAIGLNVPVFREIIAIACSAGWAYVAFLAVGKATAEQSAPYIACVMAFALAITVHIQYFEWQKDFRRDGTS